MDQSLHLWHFGQHCCDNDAYRFTTTWLSLQSLLEVLAPGSWGTASKMQGASLSIGQKLVINIVLLEDWAAKCRVAALGCNMTVCHCAIPLNMCNDGLKVWVKGSTWCDMGQKFLTLPALYCPATRVRTTQSPARFDCSCIEPTNVADPMTARSNVHTL